jgi:hypothetical protein
MIKVHCTLDELMAVVAACDLEGEWSENHAETGEVLNWWPSTGTIQFQGKFPEAFQTRFLCQRSMLTGRASKINFSTTLAGQLRS